MMGVVSRTPALPPLELVRPSFGPLIANQTPHQALRRTGFAAAGGSVFATSWTTAGISIWRWSRSAIPADVTAGTPDPTGWGTPTATWLADDCDPTAHFNNLQIVL